MKSRGLMCGYSTAHVVRRNVEQVSNGAARKGPCLALGVVLKQHRKVARLWLVSRLELSVFSAYVTLCQPSIWCVLWVTFFLSGTTAWFGATPLLKVSCGVSG